MLNNTTPTHRHSSPEEKLGAAILSRAVLDLFQPGVSPKISDDDSAKVRREALLFLTSTGGSWAASRRDICDICGQDADIVRRRVVKWLDGAPLPTQQDGRFTFGGGIDKARELWATEKRGNDQAHANRLARAATMKARLATEAMKKEQFDPARRTRIDDAVLSALQDGPLTIRELVFATDGEYSNCMLRASTKRLEAAGRLNVDGPTWSTARHLIAA